MTVRTSCVWMVEPVTMVSTTTHAGVLTDGQGPTATQVSVSSKYRRTKKTTGTAEKPALPPTNSLIWHPDQYIKAYVHIYYPSKTEWPCLRPFKVTQGQIWQCHIGIPIYGFLLMFNSNIGPNYFPLRRDISLRNLSQWQPLQQILCC